MRVITCLFFLLVSWCAQSQLTVMTYNIRNSNASDGVNKWDNRKEKLFAVIQKANPDVLGTQEVLQDQLKDLQKALPNYATYGVGRNNGRHAGEHSAIFYKKEKFDLVTGGNFWLSETPTVPGSKSWDAAITRICSWVKLRHKNTGAEFFVFNAHFDHKGKVARQQSAMLIRSMIDSLADGNPVIVTGDFNFSPTDEGYRVMVVDTKKGVQLSDCYSAAMPPYTDCGFNVTNKQCGRIDYVFCSQHFRAEKYLLHTDNDGTYYPSDHLAVSAILLLR